MRYELDLGYSADLSANKEWKIMDAAITCDLTRRVGLRVRVLKKKENLVEIFAKKTQK